MTTTRITTQTIKKGQNAHLAWLKEDASLADIAEVLVSLANQDGGMLLIGVDAETKKVEKVEDTTRTIDLVLQATLALTPPLIIPVPSVIKIQRKNVIRVDVPGGLPHIYAYKGRYLQRIHRNNNPLDPPTLRRLMIQRGAINFESEQAIGTTLDDIDWEQAQKYVSQLHGIDHKDMQKALLKRGCLKQIDKKLVPTNAGILLFGKDPQQHLRGTDITAVRFAGETMSDTFTRKDIVGTLPMQIRQAETFLVDHLHKVVKLRNKMEREEEFEYPMEAARELVVNAVAHRDYSISGDGIRLFLFRNHMEVTNPGGLAGPVTVDNIKDERFSRNPVIVQVLSDMGFIERLGYGIDRVIELMKHHNMKEPKFEEQQQGFRVQLYNSPTINPPKPTVKQPAKDEIPTAFNGKFKEIPINPRQEAALLYLHQAKNYRIINSDMKKLFPEVHQETLRRDLADLVTKGILEKQGKKRGSYYILKQD